MIHSCVVFDIDDTLYLERDYVRSGFVAVSEWVLRESGAEDFFDISWNLFINGRRGDIFNVTFKELGLKPDSAMISAVVNVYRNHRPSISLLPDAESYLNFLQGIGRSIAFLSDGPLESQKNKVSALGLDKWTDKILLTDEFPNYKKPSHLGFESIQRQFEKKGSECVYIADNVTKDFVGPKSLGWMTIRIKRPGGLYYELDCDERFAPKITISSFDELFLNSHGVGR